MHLVATQYATSLYALAEEGKVAPGIAEDMTALHEALKDSSATLRLLSSPIVAEEKKQAAIRAFAKGAGFKELTVKFLGTVVANNRTVLLPMITALYVKLAAEAAQEVPVTIRSAKKLDKETAEGFRKGLEKELGKKIALDFEVDKSLISGVVIQMGSKLMDFSLSGKLERLKTHLTKNTANA